jgi:hypothetical protein
MTKRSAEAEAGAIAEELVYSSSSSDGSDVEVEMEHGEMEPILAAASAPGAPNSSKARTKEDKWMVGSLDEIKLN